MNVAYLGLGSNLDNPINQVKNAIVELNQPAITVTACSSLYSSKPVGYTEQDDFVNAVVKVSTSLLAMQLLHYCQQIEQQHLRQRIIHWGPRTLDIDILLFNDDVFDSNELMIPHPQMLKRDFVITPLLEIAPELKLPDNTPLKDYANSASCDLQIISEA